MYRRSAPHTDGGTPRRNLVRNEIERSQIAACDAPDGAKVSTDVNCVAYAAENKGLQVALRIPGGGIAAGEIQSSSVAAQLSADSSQYATDKERIGMDS